MNQLRILLKDLQGKLRQEKAWGKLMKPDKDVISRHQGRIDNLLCRIKCLKEELKSKA